MKRALMALLTAVTAALALAACGGDGGGAQLSAAEFREQADELCSDAQNRFDEIAEPESEEELQEYLEQVVPILREETDKLKDLNPPDELQEDWDRVIELQEENVGVAEEARDAAGDDPQRAIEILNEADTNEDELTELAQKLELQECGQE
jgi:hypothetical protein